MSELTPNKHSQQVSDDLIIEDIVTPMVQVEKPPVFEPWYAPNTIQTVVKELEEQDDGKMNYAFLTSSPSFYFALKNEDMKKRSKLFDDDIERWENESGFINFDFREPSTITEEHVGKYGFIIVDPTSINKEFWELYSTSIKKLLSENGKILACTVSENETFMKELLGVSKVKYVPSIPNLV
eukprot:gene6803-10969_t